MPDSSKYNTLFGWSQLTRTKDTTLGEMVETLVPSTDLWGYMDHQAGKRLQSLGQDGVVIVLRNYPAVKPEDVLTHQKYGVKYGVDSVYHGDQEMVVRATVVT